jgi:hypothetical protein
MWWVVVEKHPRTKKRGKKAFFFKKMWSGKIIETTTPYV